MPKIETIYASGSYIIYDEELIEKPSAHWFSSDFWQQKQAISGQSVGRGVTYFIQQGQAHWVLRHYRRGGLVAKVSEDRYLFTGLKSTRPWREFALLKEMKAAGLAVPAPIAARVQRKGLFYQGDLLIEKIAKAQDCHHLLLEGALEQTHWRQIGQEIAKLHMHQVYHHDLNIHNIMLDEQGKVWLIDFDRCGYQQGDNWKMKNLARLQRSLLKEKAKHANYHWQDTNWQALLEGYSS